MSKIAIVAALEREVKPLVKRWRVSEKEYSGRRFRFFEKQYAVLVCGGIGAQAARRAAEAVIALYQPGAVWSAGFAGALDSKFRAGDVVRPQRVLNSGDGSTIEVGQGAGVLVSFDAIANASQKTKLRDSFGAQAVDMEAAAVGRAAELRGVGFGAVKVISDEVGFDFPSMEPFVDSEGRFHEGRLVLFSVLRPWLWLQLMRLGRNSSKAAEALCAQLARDIDASELSFEPERMNRC
jgi:adenosylhomocysteine nucleosidase